MLRRLSRQARRNEASARGATLPVVSIGGIFLFVWLSMAALSVTKVAPVSAVGGPFALVAHDGRAVSERDFIGSPFLVFFGYTHCQDICPLTLLEISEALRALGPNANIRAAFVTVDPERDTPDILKDYLANFDARIIGLTGERGAVDRLLRSYSVYSQRSQARNGADYEVDHTVVVYLMDKHGQFLKRLDVSRRPNDVARDLQRYL